MRMNRKFDTKVQHIKYKVLREVARRAWTENLAQGILELPKQIIPGSEATMRCCVYKERAIIAERIQLAVGGSCQNPNVVEVINIACDECPVGGFEVSTACRGCIAHRCEEVCPRDAIVFDHNQKAYIDKNKCIGCGKCAAVCPYSAIRNHSRPCENACKVNAISMGEHNVAVIDQALCTACGACVYQCPFGAMQDKSHILTAIDLLQKSQNSQNYKVYAVVAPSISSQFAYAKLGQVISGIKALGFYHVVEAALGADMVAWKESEELAQKGFLISSCCPAFVSYIHKSFPSMQKHISHNLSPMAEISKYIKKITPDAKVIFIGPCTAKKEEAQLEQVKPYVDCVLTFEELQALFDSRDLDITALPEEVLDNASYFGRIFARSGGLSEAVAQALKERALEFDLRPIVCDGIEQCRIALLKAEKGRLEGNFIEGMACVGGCIGGAGCLSHGPKDKGEVDKYSKQAFEQNIADAVGQLPLYP